MTTILHLDASGRHEPSFSRRLSAELVDKLEDKPGATVITRDLATSHLPFVNDDMASGYFTEPDKRSEAQLQAMAPSEALVDELLEADILVIGTAMYNHGAPAALKAWIDLVLRTYRTFRNAPDGPVGLTKVKKAYLVVASGSTELFKKEGIEEDFLTPYVKFVLAHYLKITDITVISAAGVNAGADEVVRRAREQIAQAV
jgi:FMN-dependent NADH-azoreductase